jgi:tRNA threonylcarbamoyladenosine biosynthesis protein TsaB
MPGDAPLLAIECSNPPAGAGVAVGRPGSCLGGERLDPSAGPGEDLLPAIDRLFARVGLAPTDLGGVAVSVGPGGYTSLRIGVAAAKSIAATLARLRGGAIPCFAVPTALAAHRGLDPALREGRRVVVALAWKRESAWVRRFPADAPAGPGGLVTLDRLGLRPGDALVAEARLVERLRGEGRLPAGVEAVAPALDPVAVLEASGGLEPVSALELAPLYPREPEAVTTWRSRAGAQSG